MRRSHPPRRQPRVLTAICEHVAKSADVETAKETAGFPEGGLFVSDYSTLPTLTNDMAQAKRDIDIYGYALWANALTEEQVTKLSARIIEQHEEETAQGKLDFDPGPTTGNVGSIANKGEEFTDLLVHSEATELLTHILGQQYHLSTGFVKIVKPGAKAELLHTDQWWSAVPQKRIHGQEAQPAVRAGSITREIAYTADWHAGDNGNGPGTVSYIPPCNANQAVFCVTDFTPENGATKLVPGSHLAGRHPTKHEAEEGGKAAGAIDLCAPAGTCIVFDSRCWHMSGAMVENTSWRDERSGKPWRLGAFYNYVAPMIRQNENWAMSLDPEVSDPPHHSRPWALVQGLDQLDLPTKPPRAGFRV
jgi:ectoine hydroxylase-related dioxygenase (phytanoyl-CoA dioxygenase family)